MLTKADWTKIAPDNLKNDAVTAIAGYNKHCLELKKLKTVDSVINAMSSASAFLTASEKCAKELKALSESSDPTLNKQKIKACIASLKLGDDEAKKYRASAQIVFATHTEAVAALKKVTKRCSSDLKNLDREVSTILQELKKLNGNIGQAEGLIKEAKNQLVLNAGEIQKHGHIVKNVADCLRANDANFNKSFTAWNDQVNKWVKAQAKVEKNWQSAIKLYGPIDSLKKEMEQSECLLKDLINDSVAEARDFLALKVRINKFHKNARTDNGDRTFESFRDFPTTVKSSEYKSYAAKELEKTLAKMKTADAHSYLMEEAAKYGFDERQLAKAIKLAEAHKKAMKNIANALNETENDPTKKAKLIENLTKIRDELISIDDRYKRGRRNQELADRLAADANKAYKKKVEAAMDLFTNSAATADQLVRSLA